MQAISREALPRPATPKGVNSIWATKWAFIYVKRAKAKNSVLSSESGSIPSLQFNSNSGNINSNSIPNPVQNP